MNLRGASDYGEVPWTPADGTGQLPTPLVVNDAFYLRHAVSVEAHFDVTFPSNTNAQFSRLSGLPLTSVGGSPGGGVCYFSDYGAALGAQIPVGVQVLPGSQSFDLYNGMGQRLSNGAVSGRTFRAVIHYKASPEAVSAVVFIGDSITAQWWLSGYRNGITNKGVGGETSQQMLARFATDVVALAPSKVHILAGANDIIINHSTDVAAVQSMAAAAVTAGILPILGTVPPIDPIVAPASLVTTWNSNLLAMAAVHGYSVVDYYSALILPNGKQNPALFVDGVHPNACGFDVMFSLASKLL